MSVSSTSNPTPSLHPLKPPRLRPGDQIGIISPAGPVDETELEPGLELLETSGLEIYVAPHVYERRGYLAGGDEARLEDLHTVFGAQEIKAIFCARGGYGSLRLLDKTDYDLIRENPKIFVGYSDITALLMAIHVKTNLVTFHGPMVRELGSKDRGNWEGLLRLLSSDLPLQLELKGASSLISGKAEGLLVGGNLSLVSRLIGTPYMPSLEGCILFLEERGEPVYRLDRMLTHLRLSGQLDGVCGLILGQFERCGQRSAINALFMGAFSYLDIPMVTGLSVGHGPENLALPVGLRARLDTELMELSTTEACVR